MEEGQVTVDGTSYQLDTPFHVIATQNPLDMEGTHALAEAQRDRFMAWLSMGYPSHDAERSLVSARDHGEPIDQLRPVVSLAEALKLIESVRHIFVDPALVDYAVAITRSTRSNSALSLGASPRAAIHLVAAAKGRAAILERRYVLPDDIQALAVPVLAHRVMLATPSRGPEAIRRAANAIQSCLTSVPVPVPIKV
jgi:MoxR-like ATPase